MNDFAAIIGAIENRIIFLGNVTEQHFLLAKEGLDKILLGPAIYII